MRGSAALAAMLLASPVGAQPAEPAEGRYERGYHVSTARMENGWTAVDLAPVVIGTEPFVELFTSFHFRGTEPAATPGSVSFAVVAWSTRERFADSAQLSLVLDGATVRLPTERRAQRGTGGLVQTVVHTTLPRATLLRLARARTADVRVDTLRFPIDSALRGALADFAGRMTPAGFRAARSAPGAASSPKGDAVQRIHLSNEVDTPARPRGTLRRPPFPLDAPPQSRRVFLRFVVDTAGRVVLPSIHGEAAVADSSFLRAVNMVAGQWRFSPAVKAGTPVPMEVRQVLTFFPQPEP